VLAHFSVHRWQATLVVFIALIALGMNALFAIPKAEDPTFPLPSFTVAAVLPGATPDDLERLVVDPLETKLKALDDLKTIKTEIHDGLAVTDLEFRSGIDTNRKHDELLRELNALRPELPKELVRLDVTHFNAAMVNILTLALVSDTANYKALSAHARALKRRLENVPGVGKVELAGLPAQEVLVTLDLPRLVAFGLSPLEVINAIGAGSVNVAAGAIETGARRFNVKTNGDYRSVSDVRATVVRMDGSRTVRLSDVADVKLSDAEAVHLTRFNGHRAVLVGVAQREGQNLLEVSELLQREVEEFTKTLASDLTLEIGFEQVKNVRHTLNGFVRDFALAIFLVLLTLLPLGLRASLVVMISIPLSLCMGLLVLQVTGFTINQVSVVGFVISLGLLVDDSVVVVENITRHIRSGISPREAAVSATKQISVSVLGCTATLVFAFVPLLALPGTAGQFIRGLPVAIIATITASLLVSLTVVPFLSSVLLEPESEHGNVFLRALHKGIDGTYRPVLARALARPAQTLGITGALFLGSIALIPSIGFSLFPAAGMPQFMIHVEAEDGASLEETDRATRFVEAELARHPEVVKVATSLGKGHPMVYYNVAPVDEHADRADVFVEISTRSAAAQAKLYEQLRQAFAKYPGAKLELTEFQSGPPVEAPIVMRLLGNDQASLQAAALEVEKVINATPGTRDVRNPGRERKTDLHVLVERDRAALLGVPLPDVDRAVHLAVSGIVAGQYREDGVDSAYDIRVTVPRMAARSRAGGSRPGLEVLDGLYVAGAQGAMPLSQIAHLSMDPSAAKLRHYNKERSEIVFASVRDGFNTDRVTKQVLATLEQLRLPAGVRVQPAGEIESREESFGGMGMALLVAVFGVLAVLVLEFRTFKSVWIVASVIPLGVIGGLVALWLSGNSLSFTANVGFVALMGIEVKNSILLVDFCNELRADGMSLDDAIQEAGQKRFVPILLTTLTAIGGLVPLVLEHSNLYSPLALVILGGLISSTVLTRVVTPVLYKLLAPEVSLRSQARPVVTAESVLEDASRCIAM